MIITKFILNLKDMPEPKARVYSRYNRKAVSLMGKLIRLQRKEKGLTSQDLADRVGISRTTLQKIEKGDMRCEIGLVFEAASLVGVRLFDTDTRSLGRLEERIEDKIALLPKPIHTYSQKVEDDF